MTVRAALGQRGFTLIELLAVMAIIAVLAAIIAPAVSGSKEASIDAQTVQDAMQVRRAGSNFFDDQTSAETRKFHTVTTTTKLPTAGGLAAEDGDPKRVVTAKQVISSRWPEKFVTSGTTTFDSLATYSDVFETRSADPVVDTVILLDGDGLTISGRTFLEQMTAIDIDTLVEGNLLSDVPKGFDLTSSGFPNFLWLFDKSTASRSNPDDSREVAVFKLLKVEKLEGQKTAGGTQKVTLTYRQIFGSPSPTIPIANPQSVTTNEDTAVNIALVGSDPENDAITFAIVDPPSHGALGTLNATTGAVTYTPNANFNGSDSFTFKTNDGQSDSSPQTVSITVNAVNDPPFFNSISAQSVDEDSGTSTVTITGIRPGPASGTDVDSESGQTVTLTAVSSNTSIVPHPATSTVSNGSATISFKPVDNANGSVTISVTANDGQAASSTFSGNFVVTIIAVNDTPVALDDSATTTEDTAVAINVLANDSDIDDNDTLDPDDGHDLNRNSITILSGPSNGSTATSTNTVTYTPNADFNGGDSFVYRVCDFAGACASATTTVTVSAVNDAPTIVQISDVTVGENTGTTTITLTGIRPGPESATDESGQTVTVSATSSNTSLLESLVVVGTPSGTTTTLSFKPAANTSGTTTITVTVDDGQSENGTTTTTFVITVNTAPTFTMESSTTTATSTTAQTVNITDVSDAEGDTITFSATSSDVTVVTDTSVQYNSGSSTATLLYTPVGTGTVTVTVTATDSAGAIREKTIVITVS